MVGEYKLFKLLGKGSFGEVYLTQKGNNPQILATKKLDKKQTDRPSVKKYFENEISIMKELNHPNIVKFYDMLASYSHYYVVMEYCNGGGLSDCLKKYKKLYHRPFTQQIVQYLMRQIIEGLKYLHSRKIIHRDIKLDNILVTFSNDKDKNSLNMLASQVKIIDFGLATRLGPEDLTYTALGSPINMDPLILKKYNKAGGYEKLQGYNEKADIWSLGTICYEMLTGEAMFKVNNMKELMTEVEKGNYTIPINSNFSKEAVAFLNSMLQYDPNSRLSAEELAQQDFMVKNVREFTQVDLSMVSNKIDNNGLHVNVKQNQTIWNIFNNDEDQPEINPINNNNQKVSKDTKEIRRNSTEQEYIFSNNIYHYNSKYNRNFDNNNIYNYPQTERNFYIHDRRVTEVKDRNNKNYNYNKINENNPLHYNNRLTEGFVSPGKNKAKFFEHEKKEEKKDMIKVIKEKLEKEEKEIKEIKEIKEKQRKENNNKKKELTKEEEEKINKYIGGLLEEYKAAEEYFHKHDLKNQEEDANRKCSEIQKIKLEFNQGNVGILNNLPKPINPEYIYGCSTTERTKKFKAVLNKYENEKNQLEEKIKELILKLKKLEPEKYSKIKSTVMPKIESDKERLDKLKKVLEGFRDKFENIWVPAPEISNYSEKEKTDENGEYKLKIYLGKTDYKKDDLNIRVILKMNENKSLMEVVKLKNIGEFDKEFIWKLEPEEWSNIEKYFFIIDYWCKDYEDSSAVKLNISKIKDEKELLFNFPIELISQNIIANISINIKAIIPEEKKKSDSDKKDDITIKKIYPSFNGKSADTNEVPNSLINYS